MAAQTIAFGDKLLFGRFGMHQQHIAITAHGILDRLAGTDSHHVDGDAGLFCQDRQQIVIQTAIFGRGGRLDDDGVGDGGAGDRDTQCQSERFHVHP